MRALAIVASLAAFAGSARAQELPVAIEWQAPPECPDGAAVAADLERIVHVEPDRTPPALAVSGTIARDGDVYRLELTIDRDGESGTRSLTAASCPNLLRAATLVLALSLGEGVQIRTEPVVETPEPEPRHVEPEPEPAPVEIEPEPEPDPEIRASIGIAGGVGSGLLPSIAPRAEIDGSLGLVGWRARLAIASDVFASKDLGAGVTAELSAIEASGAMCWAPELPAARFELCARAALALLVGWSSGATRDGSAAAWLGIYGASVAVAIPIGPIELVARANVSGAPARPVLEVRNLGPAHRAAALVLSGSLGVSFAL